MARTSNDNANNFIESNPIKPVNEGTSQLLHFYLHVTNCVSKTVHLKRNCYFNFFVKKLIK